MSGAAFTADTAVKMGVNDLAVEEKHLGGGVEVLVLVVVVDNRSATQGRDGLLSLVVEQLQEVQLAAWCIEQLNVEKNVIDKIWESLCAHQLLNPLVVFHFRCPQEA